MRTAFLIAALVAPACCLVMVDPARSQQADVAAAQHAWNAFLGHQQSCGDKFVMAIDVTPPQMNGFTQVPGYKPLQPYTIYNQATGLQVRRSGPAGNVTAADRLNNIEWKGSFQIVAQAAREVTVSRSAQAASQWTPWKADVVLAIVEVEHRNGSWLSRVQQSQSIESLGRFARIRGPSCSEVPA